MKLRTLVLGSTMMLGAIGCSSSGSDDKPATMGAAGETGAGGESGGSQEQVLQIFSWWTAPGEAEALRALEETYQKVHKGARVSQYSNTSAATWQEVLGEKIEESPWDVFQLSASDLTKFRADHDGAVADLADIYAEAGLDDVMIPEIKNVITQDDGKPYGVVTGVHRNNAFIYNKGLLDDNNLEPPTTVAEFLEVCAALKEAGITPVASDMDTWVLRILFDEILAGTMGAEGFDDFIKGKVKADDADVQASLTSAIDTFDMVITDYVDVEKSSAMDYDWSSAAQDLYDGNAAMLFHGDWAKGYLVHLGWEPGVDFGVSGPPGANDLFVYGADMFGLPSTAPHTQLGKDFLSVVASPEGQIAFNSFKGATPMRSDIIDDITDQTLKDSLNNLATAKVLMPGHANAGWDMGIEAFAMDHDKEALLKVYTETAP